MIALVPTRDAYSAIAFTRSATGSVEQTLQSQIECIPFNVKNFGAKGDGMTDDTNAIKAAIAAAQTRNFSRSIYFPIGIYAFSSQLLISEDIHIFGESLYSSDYPTGKQNGSILLYTGNGGEAAVKVYKAKEGGSDASMFNFSMERIGIKTRAAKAESIGLHLVDQDNFILKDVTINGVSSNGVGAGFTDGIVLEGCSIGWISGCTSSYNTTNQIVVKGSARRTGRCLLHFKDLHTYLCTGDSLRIENSADIYFDGMAFMEACQNTFHIVQPDRATKVNLFLNNIVGTNNGAVYTNPRFLKIEAVAGNHEFFVPNCVIKGSRYWLSGSDYAIEYVNGTNSNANTEVRMVIDGGDYSGMTTKLLISDSEKLKVETRGFIHAGTNDYKAHETLEPIVAGALWDDNRANPE